IPTISRKPSHCRWSPCTTIRHTCEKPAQLFALYPRKGKRSKCGRITPIRSPIDRTSYLKVRSPFDLRIQPQPKNARRSSSSSKSLSLSESEYEGLTSRPVRSYARIAKEMQKHP